MIGDTSLGPGVEFDVIRAMRARWGALASGIGDDAAALVVPRGELLLASTDSAIEDVHFRRAWLGLPDIGYRAVTAALSDLAAMGARPLGVLVSLQLPRLPAADVASLADGIGAAVKAATTVIRGGNVTAASQIGITTTVLGAAYQPLARGGARPGDLLYVTGAFGGPRAAVRAFDEGKTPAPEWLARLSQPVARLAEARWLASRGATAAIDLSDGLGGDAAHLAAASNAAMVVELDRVPLLAGVDPDDVFGGEEYELLVAARSPFETRDFHARFGVPLTQVGRVEEGPAGTRFTRRGERVAPPGGHDHFSR